MAEITGTTDNRVVEQEIPTYVHISEIFDEYYDDEMKLYCFEFYTYSGQHIHLRLRKKDIERFMLYMKKEEADQRYMNHIIDRS
jgi:hypothetical protein